MTETPDNASSAELCRLLNMTQRRVREMLRGSGLRIQERERDLVISNPRAPEKGRIYVNSRDEVSWKRTVWDYFGRLDGCGNDDPAGEPCADAGRIIGTLGGGSG